MKSRIILKLNCYDLLHRNGRAKSQGNLQQPVTMQDGRVTNM